MSTTSAPDPPSWAHFLLFCLAAACLFDLAARRIPNVVCAGTLAGGLCLAALRAGAAGVSASLAAAAAGAALALALFFARVLAPGDVKFFAAAASFLAPAEVLPALGAALAIGGVLAALILCGELVLRLRPRQPAQVLTRHAWARACMHLWVHGHLVMAARRRGRAQATTVPFALALAGGILWAR